MTLLTYAEVAEVLEAVTGRRPDVPRLDGPGTDVRVQARPGSLVQAIAPFAEGLRLAQFTWGFSFPDSKKLIFNTRLDSARGKSGFWDEAIRNGRCILPVASFFEPHATETERSPRTGRAVKRQYEFAAREAAPLLLASVQQQGRLSIVTTEPNADVAPIHKRMPLALSFQEVDTWLAGDYASLADRSDVSLTVRPEHDAPAAEPKSPQLALF